MKVIDLETDGLDYTKIHVMVGRDLDTDKVDVLTNYKDMSDYVRQCDSITGHNFLGFDWWAIRDILGIDIPVDSVTDTLVMSRLDHSNRDGGHSLEVWGSRLGVVKPEHTDWSVLSNDMIHRCVEDTKINSKLYRLLKNSLNSKQVPWTEVELECFVHWKMKEVERNGFYFDIEQCMILRAELNDKRAQCELQLARLFPSLGEAKKVGGSIVTTTPTSNKDGTLSVRNLRGLPVEWFTSGCPFTFIDWPEPSLTRPDFIRRHLQIAGWKPKVFTPTGVPKLDDEQLDDIISQVGEKYRPYQEWRILNTRITKQIDKWLEFYNDSTHREHGKIIHIGTRTHRMAHRDPPITQVPSSDAPYGSECRQLWGVPSGKYLLGCDASGIQLRVLAHYTADQEWIDKLTAPGADIHQIHADEGTVLLNKPVLRSKIKTISYAFLLGSGIPRLATEATCSLGEAEELRDLLYVLIPGLNDLIKSGKKQAKKGFIRSTISQRWIPTTSEWHGDWLASLLQEGEATVMKRALRIWTRQAERKGVQYSLSTQNHDEWQTEVETLEDADTLGKMQTLSIMQAGRYYNVKCPLDGQYKIGKTWKETH